jgi:hypothetical protein
VRRGLEAGAPLDTAARQHRDAVLAEEPRSAFGRVARVLVLRNEEDEPARELFVQRGEEERQGRLRHPGGRRERLGERAQPVALAELGSERMQDRLVHDERPNRTVRRDHRSSVPAS